MPVRSLRSSVLKWPDARAVDIALRRWVARVVEIRPEVVRVGYFGSYARGDWGPGSDLDIIIIVESTEEPFERRAVQWDGTELPVPAELLVYTRDEWQELSQRGRFYQTLMRETIWVYPASG
ncbi:MAG: nucleotidyltransferase domain-containing protein [Candidatus Binatia bacterium]